VILLFSVTVHTYLLTYLLGTRQQAENTSSASGEFVAES